jgi:hypothetical protein
MPGQRRSDWNETALPAFAGVILLAAVFLVLHFCRLSIYRDTADKQRGEHIVSFVVSEDENATSGGGDSDVVASRDPQLTSFRQVDRERNERRGMRKLPNITNHKE